MYGSRYIFGKGVRPASYVVHEGILYTNGSQFFIVWVIVSIIWLWLTMLMVTFYPLVDGGIEQTVSVFERLIGRREGNKGGA